MAAIDPAMTAADKWKSIDPAWAWKPYEPSAEVPWDRRRAAHLYRRAAFAGDWTALEDAIAAGPTRTIDRLLSGGPDTAAFYAQAAQMVESLLPSAGPEVLAGWWLYVLEKSPHPLRERMTLFWHNHFATSIVKVEKPRLMYVQNVLFREHALGKFGPLLSGIAKDPAMLIWLDSTTNRKAHPNENFAREVMELFSLGRGNYTERDIQEAARAFTGWEVRQAAFFRNARQHDDGPKTVLGETGGFDGQDVIEVLLKRQASAQFLLGKLCKYFLSETVDLPPALVEPLTAQFRKHELDVGWLVETMLRSNLFFSDLCINQRIKSPVEYAVGLLRSLEATTNGFVLADDLRTLGQALFAPPNVKGWDGYLEWINSSTLVGRANLTWNVLSNSDSRYTNHLELEKLAAVNGVGQGAALARRMTDLMLGEPASDAVMVQLAAVASDSPSDRRMRIARLVHAIASLPEYQLS